MSENPQRITEQDAREIASSAVDHYIDNENTTVHHWFDERGKTLLSKLSENRDPVQATKYHNSNYQEILNELYDFREVAGIREDYWSYGRICKVIDLIHPINVTPSKAEVPSGYALIPLDANGLPKITNTMKADNIGEFELSIEFPEWNEETEEYTGEMENKKRDVPWDKCKEIYKAMAWSAMHSKPLPPLKDGDK